MRTIKKIAALALVIVSFLVVSCEEQAVREPSPEANPSSNKVYFPDQSGKVVLGIDAKSFTVPVSREIDKDALTVSLKTTGYNGFTIPKQVSFAAGSKDATIEIAVGDVELMKNYLLTIEVEHNQTNPYDTLYNKTKTSIAAINVLKEDFAPYAEGKFTSAMFGASWDMILEFSPATKTYRLSDLIEEGYDYLFTVAENGVITQSPKTAVQTGYMHPTYGMISYQLQDGSAYDAATDTYTFLLKYTVAAGSFGVKTEKLQITKKL